MPADASAGEAADRGGDRWRGVVWVALLALTFLLGCFPMADFDVWWYLRAGQFVMDHGAVPRFDIYTYTNRRSAPACRSHAMTAVPPG